MTRWAMLVDIEPQTDPGATTLRTKPALGPPVNGAPYVGAVGALGGVGPYSYAVTAALPTGLSLDAVTGEISGTPASGVGYIESEVEVTDAAANVVYAVLGFDVLDAMTLTGTLAPCEATIPYSSGLSIVGAVGAVTWGLIGSLGSNPIFIDTGTGVLSGTAVTAGTYPAIITATDSIGQTTQRAISFVVEPELFFFPILEAPAGLVGAAYAFQPLLTGGLAPFTFDASVDIPTVFPGLLFNPNTGLIYGTPTAPSGFVNVGVSVTCTDFLGATVSELYYFTVNTPDTNPAKYGLVTITGDGVTTTFNVALPNAALNYARCIGELYEVNGTSFDKVNVDIKFKNDATVDVGPFVAAPSGAQVFKLRIFGGTW